MPNKRRPGTNEYLIRNIDQELWNRAVARADAHGVTMRDVLLTAIDAYASGRLNVSVRVQRKLTRAAS